MQSIFRWIGVIFLLFLIAFGGFFVLPGSLVEKIKNPTILKFHRKIAGFRPYSLGLDLQGGVHLVYSADLSKIEKKEWKEAMEGLRDVIERRVNLFGVKEPIVQIERVGEGYRLIVELAGIEDPKKAIEMIGKTPYLEFREEMSEKEKKEFLKTLEKRFGKEVAEKFKNQPLFKPTKLTGKYLKRAYLQFDPTTMKPSIGLEFNKEGAKIFEELTKRNVGKRLAIFIDNQIISAPVVREKISGGKAQITGDFTIEEAKRLARNLNAGALPVPIKLIVQENIGPFLGKISIKKSIIAGGVGLLLLIFFMILIYRLSGILASIALAFYGVCLLSLFKFIPVTLTLSGIAGFILSLGMAVDANILIFERLREEILQRKKLEPKISKLTLENLISRAFSRAWPAIRDGNLTTLITCFILFLMASGFVQGFALTLGIGILTSMFSAMIITRFLMKTFAKSPFGNWEKIWRR